MEFDALLLSRLQFAFTISFHIVFPALSIGLASYLAVLEGLWLRTQDAKFLRLYDYWVKIFALAFAMGVVSGIVMSYQFGTNWSRFSQATGNILGPLLGYEVLSAFFLESSFLGIMLFGRRLVGPGLHFIATCIVAIGTLASAFWILAANSWMQYPTGHELRDGVFYAVDWIAIVFSPTFPYRLVHMVLAAYLSTAFVVAGVASYLMLRRRAVEDCKTMLKMAFGLIVILAPLQLVAGHQHGLSVYDTQPTKLAAMEGHWETYEGRAPLILFAWPDEESESNLYELAIPEIGSWIVTGDWNGAITGLKEWPPEDRPNVPLVFWSFRIMVGIGFLMILYGILGAYAAWAGMLDRMRWFLALVVPMLPSGLIALLAGWITAEAGRQPYTVYGLLRTADSVSPIPGEQVALSLLAFMVVYSIVFPSGVFYMGRIAVAGPGPKKKIARAKKPAAPKSRKAAAKRKPAKRKPMMSSPLERQDPTSAADEPKPPLATGDASSSSDEATTAGPIESDPRELERPQTEPDESADTDYSLRDIARQLETDDLSDDFSDFKQEVPDNGNR